MIAPLIASITLETISLLEKGFKSNLTNFEKSHHVGRL